MTDSEIVTLTIQIISSGAIIGLLVGLLLAFFGKN